MPKIKRESRQFIVINEEKLITEVQNRPILYDKALKGYRKPAIRESAWQEVADNLQSTVEECKKRWRSLRDAFMKQYKLFSRGDQSLNSIKKKWIFYEQMEFLAPFFDASINGIKFDIDDEFIETVTAEMNENGQIALSKLPNQNKGHIVCIAHPNENEFQAHHIEIDEYSEERLDDDDEHIIEQSIGKEHKKIIGQDGHIYNPLYITGELEGQQETGHSQQHQQQQTHQQMQSQNGQPKNTYTNDSDERFLLSCLSTLQRLPKKKNALARLKIQQILFDLEFEEAIDGTNIASDNSRAGQ